LHTKSGDEKVQQRFRRFALFWKKNPWYETRWKAQLDKLQDTERDEMLFMLAARWADDIRIRDQAESRLPWHYVDFPFKPEGEPASIQAIQPPQENILTAIAENERILRTGNDPARRGVALAWLFHLMGDIHQPLHAIQLFSREYPKGDRGGGDFCVRVAQDRAPLSLHRLWDGLITSSNNTRTLRNIAIELQSRFSKSSVSELAITQPEAWAKESFDIATKFAYQNGTLRGRAKGQRSDCREVTDAAVLPNGHGSLAEKDCGQADGALRLSTGDFLTAALELNPARCIKSDTPLSRFTTPRCRSYRQNTGFHCISFVAYPLP
jgi:hypothetical protein